MYVCMCTCMISGSRALVGDSFKMSTSKTAVTPFSIAASEELNLVYRSNSKPYLNPKPETLKRNAYEKDLNP